MVSATRRASYTSSKEQQRPCTDSGMPSCPARRRWFQSCMVSPTTLYPSARSMAATVEESTPPDIATAIVCFEPMSRSLLRRVHRAQFSQFGQYFRQHAEELIYLFVRIHLPQTEAHRAARAIGR